jgi:hypothetical protein
MTAAGTAKNSVPLFFSPLLFISFLQSLRRQRRRRNIYKWFLRFRLNKLLTSVKTFTKQSHRQPSCASIVRLNLKLITALPLRYAARKVSQVHLDSTYFDPYFWPVVCSATEPAGFP